MVDDLESVFARLIGRQPSEKEVENLYRVKNALNMRDNDSLWLVLMALETYDTMYRKYPAMISRHVEQIVEDQRILMATIAEAETKKALGTLSEAVSRTSEKVTATLVDASRWQSLGWAWFTFVVSGALCLFVGFVLGTGKFPSWASVEFSTGPVITILRAIARAPAGFIASVGGLSGCVVAIFLAWQEIRTGRRLGLLVGAFAMAALALGLLQATFL